MWMAQRGRGTEGEATPLAQLGHVTVAELPLGVYVDGERRNLPLYVPGGFGWRPKVGDRVLVLKTEGGGCVLGCPQTEEGLDAGEIKLSGVGCEVYLTAEGEISLSGDIVVNGEGLEEMITRIVTANMPSVIPIG